jgi:hypothetical protein
MAVKDDFFTVSTTRDDGVFFIFTALSADKGILLETGFMHRPVEASEPFGNPPVTWSEFSDLGTWVETVKYAFRTQTYVLIHWDDALQLTYFPAWVPVPFTLQQVYEIAPANP